MAWLAWFGFKHPVLIHLPIAAAVLLPMAVLTSQRPGRGIRPWWLVSRFLAWWGFVGMLLACAAGMVMARQSALLTGRGFLAVEGPLRMHQTLALASLLLGILTLRFLHRHRQDHQNLGFLALLFSVLWSGTTLATAHYGERLLQPPPPEVAAVPVAATTPVPAAEPSLPAKLLDYRALEPIQPEFVKTTVHGLRWIRTYVSPGSAEAYMAGETLPAGTLVVLVTLEDKWGRPGPDAGPLYGLEMLAGGQSRLLFYWSRVPASKRGELGGVERALWRGSDPNLEACMGCHAQGMAPLRDRSRVQAFRKPTAPG